MKEGSKQVRKQEKRHQPNPIHDYAHKAQLQVELRAVMICKEHPPKINEILAEILLLNIASHIKVGH